MENLPESPKLTATKFEISVTNSLYSSVLGLVKIYVMNLFPNEFFKNVFIKNSIASVTEAGNNDDDNYNKGIPRLSINMGYEPLEASFDGDSFLMSNFFVFRNPSENGIYEKILYDRENRIYISGMSTRAKNNFNVIITVNQEMEALNIIGYLRSKMPINRPFYINNRLIEVPLPMSLIGHIAKAKGFDLSKPDQIPLFNEVLLKHSEGRLTYKKHSSSGKFLYFYKYMTNLLLKIVDYGDIEANKENKSQMNTNITFNMEVEYHNHLYFLAETYNLPETDGNDNFFLTDDEYGSVLHWTLQLPEMKQLVDGKKLIGKLELVTEFNEVTDSTIFSDGIHSTIFSFMKYQKELHPTDYDDILNNKFTFKVLKDGKPLKVDEDFTIDWSTFTLNILNPLLNYDYKMFLYGNVGEIDQYRDQVLSQTVIRNNILVEN